MNIVILKTSHQTKKFIIWKIEKYFTKFQTDAAKHFIGKLLCKCSLKIELSNRKGERVDIINIT